MRPVGLAAALIVKDEEQHLPGCLASLAGLVDEVVVHDTGSTDATVEIARAAGARVTRGYWDGDFARARNQALAMTDAPWVLAVDADERAVADPHALRTTLARAGTTDVFVVRVTNDAPEQVGGRWSSGAARLLRAGCRWAGEVHERPERPDGPTRFASLPPAVLRLEHLGYLDADLLATKVRRNAEIGRREVARLDAPTATAADRARLPQVLLDLARSLVGAREPQAAVDVLSRLLDLAPGTEAAVQGMDELARLLLADGQDELVLALADQLARAGVDRRYVGWLRAQALAQLGRPEQAWAELEPIDVLVDTHGNVLDVGRVEEMRALVGLLAGRPEPARAALLRAMTTHGRLTGRGELLARLTRDVPAGELARELERVEPRADVRAAVLAELARHTRASV